MLDPDVDDDIDDDELRFIPRERLDGLTEATSWQIPTMPAVPSGTRARITANLAAIRVLQTLESEGDRAATPQEQQILSRWSSWGAAAQIFDDNQQDLRSHAGELRELIGEDGWRDARRTVLNAHYTDPAIVSAIWDHLRELGFTGGHVLEPGSGSGTFIGLAPQGTRMTGVELDPTTARISAKLFPQAEIRIESFADTSLPGGTFDAAVGNVPFSGAKLHDPVHNLGNHAMHNHFIVKSLALVKPGGIVAVITSAFTLDAQNPAARREIAANADFLGAVRLPTGAHRRTAGTDALTDVLILRRRDGEPVPVGGDFERTVQRSVTRSRMLDGDVPETITARINEYFDANPDMVLGAIDVGHGMYSSETVRVDAGDRDTIAELRQALSSIAAKARAAGLGHAPRELQATERRVAAIAGGSPNEFPGHIIATDSGDFTRRSAYGTLEELHVPVSQRRELGALLGLRDATVALLSAEAASAEDTDEIRGLRTLLNGRYDAYVERYGPINRCSWHPTGRVDADTGEPVLSVRRPAVMRTFRDDPHQPVVMALEDYDVSTDTAKKMSIMAQRVVSPRTPRLGADTATDAVAICLDTHARVDLPAIAELLGVDETAAREQLRGLVYADPEKQGALVPAAEYLSGDVRHKLHVAESAVADDPGAYAENIESLTKVIPEDLGPAEIDARLGAAWIEADDVESFLHDVLSDTTISVEQGVGSEWKVTGGRGGVLSVEEFGTVRVPAPLIAQSLLRQKAIRVYDTAPDESRIFNPTETEAANEKAGQLNERFSEWVWENPRRAERLAAEYNKRFNSIVLRSYDTEHMSVPGLSKAYTPRPHQLAAVARMIAEPNTGLFHAVGAGKSLEMAMGVMELKRLGLVNKPALVVPNHMLDQFSREFLTAYPQARVLAAGTEDLAGEKRRAFVARATTGDWDAIIMTRGSFQRLEVSNETAQWYHDREIQPRREYLQTAKRNGAKSRTVKQIEDQIQKAEEKLKRKLSGPVDPGITFEQTGIDYLVVDELHDYKNLATDSNIASAAIAGSQRAQNLHMKVEYLRNKHNGRAITGATATPIANSITEAYVMQKYLRPDLLENAGIHTFDQWAGTFGTTKAELEMSVDGNSWSVKERFASFRNIPELLKMWHVAADVKTPEDLNLPTPALARRGDGKRLPEVISVPATAAQHEYVVELGVRADAVRKKWVEPNVDNMLKISSDGRAAALDLRLLRRKATPAEAADEWTAVAPETADFLAMPEPDDEWHELAFDEEAGDKITAGAEWLFRIWDENTDRLYLGKDGQPHPRRGALQLVFCDLGTPGEGWNVYGEFKRQLMTMGVPEDQIAFIHDAKTDKAKAALFADAKTGKIQILIGSTSKMGVGTNVQDRVVSMLHVDCPWRPSDVEQRDGRGVRQGNQNTEIRIARLVTEGTFDARMWSTQTRKATFIHQFMKGSLDVREIDDIGDAAMNANEAVAIASGNPLVLEKAEVDAEVSKLDRLRRSHQRSQAVLQLRIRDAEYKIPKLETEISVYRSAIERRVPTRGDAFAVELGGRRFESRKEAGDALAARLYALVEDPAANWKERSVGKIGSLAGFELHAQNVPRGRSADAAIVLPGIGGYEVIFDAASLRMAGTGVMMKLENAISGLERRLAFAERDLASAREEKMRSEARLGLPFDKQQQLDRLKVRKSEIDLELQGPAEEIQESAAPANELPSNVTELHPRERPTHLDRASENRKPTDGLTR